MPNNVHPIFARILSGFAPHVPDDVAGHLAALEPRYCACGSETGSIALDRCVRCEAAQEATEGDERARAAVEALHRLATQEHSRAVADLYDE